MYVKKDISAFFLTFFSFSKFANLQKGCKASVINTGMTFTKLTN